MPHRLAIGAATALAALALAGPAAAQQVKFNGGILYHQEQLAPGVKTFTVTCPPGHVAVGGGVFQRGAGAKQLSSVPGPGARKWTFGYGFSGQGQSTVIVLVTCIKPAAKTFKVKIKTTKKASYVLPPLGVKSTKLRCPADSAPLGVGTTIKGASPRSRPRARAALDVVPSQVPLQTKIMPVRGGFDLTWRNPGMERFDLEARARCLARKAKRKRRRRKPKTVIAEVVRRDSKETAKPGFNRFTQRCGRRRVPVFGGWEIMPTGELDLTQALQRTGTANYSVFNPRASDQEIAFYLLCVRGRLTFQRDV